MNQKTTRNLIIVLLVVVIAGAFYFIKTNAQDNDSKLGTNESVETIDEAEEGTISGSFTFPSEGIPTDLTACAEQVNGDAVHCSGAQIVDEDRFIYAKGYEILLPPGQYYVYTNDGSERAFYNGYMAEVDKQGWPDYDNSKCDTDYQPIKVTVRSGEETPNITVGDWYYETECH